MKKLVFIVAFLGLIILSLGGCGGGSGGGTNHAPVAPSNLTATPGDTQVSLSWTGSSGATSYKIYQADIHEGPYVLVNSCTTTNYTVDSLTNGTYYFFAIKAVNSAGESGYSNEVFGRPAVLNSSDYFETYTPGSALPLSSGNWELVAGSTKWTVSPGEGIGNALIYDNPPGEVSVLKFQTYTGNNYTVSSKIKIKDSIGNSAQFNLLARVESSVRLYGLLISYNNEVPKGVRLYRMHDSAGNSVLGDFYSFAASFDPYVFHTFALSVNGSDITGYLDGVQICSATDSNIVTGNPGIQCYDVRACFDNFEVWEP